jgi:hypothetical protein
MDARLFQADDQIVSTERDAAVGTSAHARPAYGTIAKNKNTAKMTKCTMP